MNERHDICDVYSELEQVHCVLPTHLDRLCSVVTMAASNLRHGGPMSRAAADPIAQLRTQPLYGALYNDALATPQACHALAIQISEGARCWGIVELIRLPSERKFSDKEHALALSTIGHLLHTLRRHCSAPSDLLPTNETGIIIADPHNRIVFQDTTARRLLYFAASTNTLTTQFGDIRLPGWLLPTVDHLWQTKQALARTSLLRRESDWGTLVCRAHCLEGNTDPRPLIGIYLERHEPTVLKIARSAFDAGLSNAQRELVVHLASDKRYAEIAAVMRIKETTVVDHTRKIYDRLNVGSRRELLRTLVHHPVRRI